VSWWNPFSWTPGAPGGDGQGGRDDRGDAGIWGGLGAPGGLHAGMVLGEGSALFAVAESPRPVESLVASEIAAAYGSVGAGLRQAPSALGEAAWRELTATPVGAPERDPTDAGAGLPPFQADWTGDVTR
jgi:hypothetical protein